MSAGTARVICAGCLGQPQVPGAFPRRSARALVSGHGRWPQAPQHCCCHQQVQGAFGLSGHAQLRNKPPAGMHTHTLAHAHAHKHTLARKRARTYTHHDSEDLFCGSESLLVCMRWEPHRRSTHTIRTWDASRHSLQLRAAFARGTRSAKHASCVMRLVSQGLLCSSG